MDSEDHLLPRIAIIGIAALSSAAAVRLFIHSEHSLFVTKLSDWILAPKLNKGVAPKLNKGTLLSAALFVSADASTQNAGQLLNKTSDALAVALDGARSKVNQTSESIAGAIDDAKLKVASMKVNTSSFFARFMQEFAGVDVNEVKNGGLSIFWIGGAIWFFRNYGKAVADFLVHSVTVNVSFDSQDDTFRWMVTYLLERELAKSSTSVTASTRPLAYPGDTTWSEIRENVKEESDVQRAYFLPGEGTTFFNYKNNLMWFSRQNVSASMDGMYNRGQRASNILTIGKLGRSKNVLFEMVEQARLMSVEKDKMKTIVYVADNQYWSGNGWRRSRARPTRALSTVVLEEGLAESIVEDIKEFYDSEKWYADRGIPYRRGYMFYGYPGTGKTSLVTALAGELQLNIYLLNMSGSGLTDERLTQLMMSTASRCILLIEDVDAAFVSRTSEESEDKKGKETKLTFSGLLNALDGAAAQEGRIVVMTTNHLEKLDPALVRPGRVDRKIFFHLATQWQARELFLQFFPGGGETHRVLADEFSKAIPERKVSMAAIQGYLMRFKTSPQGASQGATAWIEEELERQVEEEKAQAEKEKKEKEKREETKKKKEGENEEKRKETKKKKEGEGKNEEKGKDEDEDNEEDN
ncbi:P-loop containing nucleoside triphosphate hydrolase protein [Cladochytrium replicatum]|nr:P-loop containing nucleoside triphosphate hydrolase protein [Cladochytrium replicatum]